ncbi:aquaporin [Bifidobacterium sp. ESL0763]|uniref:MIP/aquaporin family protein n=1 Tax=Bifidobacterium sp. ESL0763 TaxID=2983227 RepID=UPI0023F9A0BA|nr:aquaporin [Bifidobacterium sp. ESL0763]MDF7663818.1 aquaporin [Bifidobacterium sp. ESL0763]
MTQVQSQHNGGDGKTALGVLSASGGELVGSFFIFTAIYLVSALSPALYGPSLFLIAIATGLAYGVMTLVFGRLSGGQFNPAVTLAAMLTYKTKFLDGICYIIAQVLGGIFAGALARYIIPTSTIATGKMWFANAVNGFDKNSLSATQLANAKVTFGVWFAIAVELIAVIIIVAVAMRTLDGDGKATSASALAMGAAYALGVTFTYPVTGASLNPARSTGIALFTMKSGLTLNPANQLWLFWICPILAAAIVALVLIIGQLISDKTVKGGHAQADVAFDAEAVNGEGQVDFDAVVASGSEDASDSKAEGQDSFEMPSLDSAADPAYDASDSASAADEDAKSDSEASEK